jgi:hypothetical protein
MTTIYDFSRIAFAAALVSILAACGGSGGNTSMMPRVSQAIVLKPSSVSPAQVNVETPVSASAWSTMPATPANMSSTAGHISAFQVFDEFTPNVITATTAQSDGRRYGAVWGARVGMAPSWRLNNTGIVASYYMPQETDASTGAWGDIGHTLAWWKANHPDWILYSCNAEGEPTTTPAYITGLKYNVPLDIHNPAVVAYQVQLAGNYAIAHGYNALAFDEVLYHNVTGTGAGRGYFGCGIVQNGAFVKRYASASDPAWATDTVNWVKAARNILKTDATLAPKALKLIVNHPAYNVASANEQAILQNVDADLDETGFSDYGEYQAAGKQNLFKATVDWMTYAQAHGAATLIINKFDQSTPITPVQLEYSIATYLMGNQTAASLFVGNIKGYGSEQYHPEYNAPIGVPCGAYYGGATYDSANSQIYYRRFSGGLVVVNAGSLPRASEVAHLPANHAYTDLENRTLTNPLAVSSNDAYVLLTTNGCQ